MAGGVSGETSLLATVLSQPINVADASISVSVDEILATSVEVAVDVVAVVHYKQIHTLVTSLVVLERMMTSYRVRSARQ